MLFCLHHCHLRSCRSSSHHGHLQTFLGTCRSRVSVQDHRMVVNVQLVLIRAFRAYLGQASTRAAPARLNDQARPCRAAAQQNKDAQHLTRAPYPPHPTYHNTTSYLPLPFLATGNTDAKWRRRYCALKGSQLFLLRTAASPKPLAVLNLTGAHISASKTPLYPADGAGSHAESDDDVLWVLRITLDGSRTGSSSGAGGSHGSSSSRQLRLKLAASSQELQVGWACGRSFLGSPISQGSYCLHRQAPGCTQCCRVVVAACLC